MREIRTSGLMSGMWKRSMAEMLGHSQTKERANREPKPQPTPPRHISTLPYLPAEQVEPLHRFITPIAAQGRIFVAGDNQVCAFRVP
jgi:hypothetical protein